MSSDHHRKVRVLSAVVVVLLLAGQAGDGDAFDGKRKGFVIGFGGGGGALFSPNVDFDYTGLMTELRIGAGLSDRALLYYAGKQLWTHDRGAFFTYASPMLGGSYYPSVGEPRLYLSGALGLSAAAAGFLGGGGNAVYTGATGFLGVGFEPAPHWSVEFGLLGSSLPGNEVTILEFSLLVHLLAY